MTKKRQAMKPFMDQDFLLQSETARKLYHEEAEGLPIIDYHCHLNPREVAEDYRFRSIYMLSVAAEDEEYVPEKAVSGLQGWVDCFEKAELVDTIFCGGINDAGEAVQHQVKLEAAYEFGRKLK